MMDKSILYSFFKGVATDDEVGQVRQWAESTAENMRELMRERKMFDAMTLLADDSKKRNVENTTMQRIVHRPQQKPVIRLRIPQIAAMLAVAFALGMIAYSHLAKSEAKNTTVAWYETVAPLGAKSLTMLTDGTKVWLNAGSRLRYSTQYGVQNREVTLEGEAYFDVAKNKALPFEVITSGIKVKALGTAFNVKAYSGEATIETILVEGEVEVSRTEKNTTEKDDVVLLKPKQRLILSKNNNEMLVEKQVQEKRQAENEPAPQQTPVAQKETETDKIAVVETDADFMINTSWKDKRWRIESEELGSFATKLERRYNVIIDFEDNELSKYRFNGTFEDEPVEEVLRALSLAAPVKFTVKGNRVVLSRNNKFKKEHQALYEQNW